MVNSKVRLSIVVFLGLICGGLAAADPKESSDAAESSSSEAAEEAAQTDDPKPEDSESETSEDEESPAEGHSAHGEVFNEGPRQSAYLMGGTGDVSFPVSTDDPLAQKFFDQGIGQLHGFWYFEAERSFRQAATLDPDCAMTYWGMALANARNKTRARGFLKKAVERKGDVTDREKRYIEAVEAYFEEGSKKAKDRYAALITAFEEISYRYPDDLEAKAFLALFLYKGKSAGVTSPSYLAVDAFLKEILAENPMHPVHHYRIHWWDRKRPEMALDSAALSGQSAPRIAHMWHMPGHIYSKLKRYEDAAWQQEASARTDHANMMRDRVMPDQIHNFAHNNEWLIRNLSYIGRVDDAVALAKNMIEMPRHPDYNTLSKRGSSYYGRLRLFDVLSRFELHDEMITLCNTAYLPPTERESEQIKRLRMLGVAHYATGDIEGGDAQLKDLRDRLEAIVKSETEAVEKAVAKAEKEKKDKKTIEKAKSTARRAFSSRKSRVQQAVDELKGRRLIAEGDPKAGLPLLIKARVDKLEIARVRYQAGEVDKALKDLETEVENRSNRVRPLAILVDLLWESGRKEEALAQFKTLRKLSNSLDLHIPVFARLAPVAQELNLPTDWRVERTPSKDVGERPSLETLGPLRWQPSAAPEWTLADAEGQSLSRNDLNGKPCILIFYLGSGCLHCAEQLQAFGPMVKDFEEHGIQVLAISSDDREGLKRSIEDYGKVMPIRLLANSDLNVFKQYRCYDDFEQQPLHGTFLIDGDGKIRWQDISYEPQMDVKFVLEESKRLLAQSKMTMPESLSSNANSASTTDVEAAGDSAASGDDTRKDGSKAEPSGEAAQPTAAE